MLLVKNCPRDVFGIRLAHVVVVNADMVELVACQDVGFSCTCCLDSEDIEEVRGVVVHEGVNVFFFEMFVFFGIRVLSQKCV